MYSPQGNCFQQDTGTASTLKGVFHQLPGSPHHNLRHKHCSPHQQYSYASLPLAYATTAPTTTTTNEQQQQQQQHVVYAEVGAKTLQINPATGRRYDNNQQLLLRPRPVYARRVDLMMSNQHQSPIPRSLSRGSSCKSSSSSMDEVVELSSGIGLSSPASSPRGSLSVDDSCCLCGHSFVEEGAFALPCQHCMCKKCIDQMMTSSHRRDVDFVALNCPVCREPFSLDRKGRQKVEGEAQKSSSSEESLLRKDQNEANKQNNQIVACQYCEVEPAQTAQHACVTCRAFYCDICLRTTHPRKKPFINHKIVGASNFNDGTMSTITTTNSQQQTATTTATITCCNHNQKPAEVFCSNCDKLLCKNCGLMESHDSHYLCNLTEWSRTKKVDMKSDLLRLGKQSFELKRIIESLQESYNQTETASDHQESKLITECDVLIRIIQDRRDVITSKIRESKATRLCALSQEISFARENLEMMTSAMKGARDVCTYEDDLPRLDMNTKNAADRLSEAIQAAKQACNCKYDVIRHRPTNFNLDFSKQRLALENLDILEPPSLPRICDELCTQSHDKVTLQWRSSNPEDVDCYELQYAIDNQSPSRIKPDNWMIVPNIRDRHYTLHGMQTGTRYVFAVRAINQAGSNLSDVITIKTLGIPFHFDPHSLHKKLRIVNHSYSVMRDESQMKSGKSDATLYGVAGNVSIDSGRHYWEVVVCQSTIYALGVAHADVARYDWVGKNSKSWVLSRNNQCWSARHDNKDVILLSPIPFPKKIGILLDYDNGTLSFFDGASGRKLHTFNPGTFRKPLRPSFALNNRSLTINTGIVVPDHLQLTS